ncbi:keratin-associated protein 17-1-like isoform X1 [Acanthaster planci]|uniref:Keratin-associated protein 17-1-like isoform X1 n=1 Tax=Acanthaster planci TaxID=133434 RepID=A0A8B7YIZ9_ACAPL|nr:keratin-associated protein 17-1-like isoform X1 [Acanthaster planci]
MDSATTAAPSEPALPVPVIVVLAVGGYLVLIVLLVVIRQFLVARGVCMACAPCGKEDGSLQCCDCWISCAEGCNCCAYPNVKSCLDSVCGPPDNRCSMTKCVSCQTCQNNTCCGDEASGFESCCGTGDSCSNQGCECAGCDCACQAPECDTIDCFCFKVNMHN